MSLRVQAVWTSGDKQGKNISLVGKYISLVGKYISLVDKYISLVGEYISLVDKYISLVDKYISGNKCVMRETIYRMRNHIIRVLSKLDSLFRSRYNFRINQRDWI